MRPPPQPPPGWYVDPADVRGWRWWNGWEWTAYTAPGGAGYAGNERPEPAYAGERKVAPWAKAAVLVTAAASATGNFIDLALASAWKAYFHGMRVLFDSIGTRQTPPPVPRVPHWSELLLPFSLAATVLLLVWQYRAANTARRLGYPARRSPALGVGSYFIPVVGIWFPYQALRDCLPPRHTTRRVVLWYWLLRLISVVVSVAMPVLLAEVEPVGVALLVVAAAIQVGLAVCGYRMVAAIAAAHAASLGSS